MASRPFWAVFILLVLDVCRGQYPFDGYIPFYRIGGCTDRNELFNGFRSSVRACAAECSSRPTCISFEYRQSNGDCQCSNSCDTTLVDINNAGNYDWYYKGEQPSNYPEREEYTVYFQGGCSGRNEGGITDGNTEQECADRCSADAACTSFEYRFSDGQCQLSHSCNSFAETGNSTSSTFNWYLKYQPPNNPSGAGGDPHITTWSGSRYDFHGHCDLVLLQSPNFGLGRLNTMKQQPSGLTIHIRNAPYKTFYSYISHIAIQIGEDILEISGGGNHSINGQVQTVGATSHVGGYPVGSKLTKTGRFIYRVHLGIGRSPLYHGQELTIREYKDWITIGVHHPNPIDFGTSTGLMGSFPDGTLYGRDGTSIHEDVNQFGSDWIVQSNVDGQMFREPSPFPRQCNLPILNQQRRRLEEEELARSEQSSSSITYEDALSACRQNWPLDAVEDCVMDVLIAGDLEIANQIL